MHAMMITASQALTNHFGAGYTVGWVSLALINAGIAQGKNRSGGIWFLVSLLLGPIATFLMVITSDPPAKLRE